MTSAKPVPTSMLHSTKLSTHGDATFSNPSLYRSVVDGLQYATITRPGISYAVNKVSQFMHKPLDIHWKAVKRILQYLNGSLDQGLLFHCSRELRLFGFCDSDWGSDIADRKSTSGFCIYLRANLVSWSSKKQTIVSRSSVEAKFHSLAATIANLSWIQSLLLKLRQPCPTPLSVFCDNISIVLLAANPVLHNRTKHFELDLYFVRDKVIQKKVFVSHIPAIDQIAYILTKPISVQNILKF